MNPTNIKQFHVLIADDDFRLVRHESFAEARQEAIRLAGVLDKTVYHLVAVEAVAKIKPLPRFFVAHSEAAKHEWEKIGLLLLRIDSVDGKLLRVYKGGNSEFSPKGYGLLVADRGVREGAWKEITKEEAEKLQAAAKYPKYFATGSKSTPVLVARSATDPGMWVLNCGLESENGEDGNTAEQWAAKRGYRSITKEEADKLTTPSPKVPVVPSPAPLPKFPRFFTHKTGFRSSVAYHEFSSPTSGRQIHKDGKTYKNLTGWDYEFALQNTFEDGVWKEISAEEAKALTELPYPRYYTSLPGFAGAVYWRADSKDKLVGVNKDGSEAAPQGQSSCEYVERDVKNGERKRLTKEEAEGLLVTPAYPKYYEYQGSAIAYFQVDDPTGRPFTVFKDGQKDDFDWGRGYTEKFLEDGVKDGSRKRYTKEQAEALLTDKKPAALARN